MEPLDIVQPLQNSQSADPNTVPLDSMIHHGRRGPTGRTSYSAHFNSVS